MPSRRWMLPRFLSRDESEQLFPKDFEAALQGGGGRDQQVLRSGRTMFDIYLKGFLSKNTLYGTDRTSQGHIHDTLQF